MMNLASVPKSTCLEVHIKMHWSLIKAGFYPNLSESLRDLKKG